jgi:regulator of sigma E protease
LSAFTGIQDDLTEGFMLSVLWNLAAFIIALGVLITVHEFGHFWVARRCGVRVERFSIGFGKALWRAPTARYGICHRPYPAGRLRQNARRTR